MKKEKKCLKCEAYKLVGVGILMNSMGFPGFEFDPAYKEIEEQANHIYKNFKRKNKNGK